jgi:hypothetical protein
MYILNISHLNLTFSIVFFKRINLIQKKKNFELRTLNFKLNKIIKNIKNIHLRFNIG